VGFPAAAKLFSHSIIHKTEVGGVKIDLNSPEEVESACVDIKKHLEELNRSNEVEGFIVQKMVKEGIETLVGVTQDPSFGPLIMFGMGGIYTEIFKDIARALVPVDSYEAKAMLQSLRISPLLSGIRGQSGVDIAVLIKTITSLSRLVSDYPEISELDLNPVLANSKGCWCVDSRIVVG